MTSHHRADAFASALQRFEETGDATDLCGQFADGAELIRPEVDKADPHEGDVRSFWDSYLSPFSTVHTEFTHVDAADSLAVLEWESKGELTTGRPIEYRGVSLLTFDDGDLVSRFSTYFDTAAFR